MDNLAIISLKWMHIIAGSLALLAGPIAMVNQNGGQVHRISGRIYYWSMIVICLTTLVLSIYRANWLLLMIGAFTAYLVLSAYRALALKNLHKGQKAEQVDWIILIASGISAAALIITGGYLLYYGNSFGFVPLTFGFVMSSGVKQDYKRFTVPPTEKNHWLLKHITGMMGGYIATITAFLVQNIHVDPAFVVWLAPSLIIAPFISYTVRKFKKGPGKIKLT